MPENSPRSWRVWGPPMQGANALSISPPPPSYRFNPDAPWTPFLQVVSILPSLLPPVTHFSLPGLEKPENVRSLHVSYKRTSAQNLHFWARGCTGHPPGPWVTPVSPVPPLPSSPRNLPY